MTSMGCRLGLALGLALALGTSQGARAESLSDLLKRKTQAFSDAGVTGDKAEFAADLDPDVAFTNEDGSTPTKAEMVEGAGPPPPGVERALKVTDWKLRRHGDVAVATFVDVLTQKAYGQTLHYRFRSTEVWRKSHGNWRMIASQTLALSDDPPVAQLPPATLDEYVGDYRVGPGAVVRIARDGNGLSASLNGAPGTGLKPEARDVFFLPGQPRVRRIFQRGADGRVTGYVSRRDGQDMTASRL